MRLSMHFAASLISINLWLIYFICCLPISHFPLLTQFHQRMQKEINQAALFSVGHLLEKIRPCVATIEKTESSIRVLVFLSSFNHGLSAISSESTLQYA